MIVFSLTAVSLGSASLASPLSGLSFLVLEQAGICCKFAKADVSSTGLVSVISSKVRFFEGLHVDLDAIGNANLVALSFFLSEEAEPQLATEVLLVLSAFSFSASLTLLEEDFLAEVPLGKSEAVLVLPDFLSADFF